MRVIQKTCKPSRTGLSGEDRAVLLAADDTGLSKGVTVDNKRGDIEVLARYADHPSAYYAMNKETDHFMSANVDGLIAYRPSGKVLFQFGGVFAPPAAQATLLDEFCVMAKSAKKHVCAVQIRGQDLPLYQQAGFRINQLGASYVLDLKRFTVSGTRFMKMRNKIARASKAGVTVAELGVDAPRSEESWAVLKRVTEEWLHNKGCHKKLIEFMVGELGEVGDLQRRVFVAQLEKRVVGFISYVPAYGTFAGLLHDLTRRLPEAPPGVMELINATAIKRFQSEGIAYLNLGFTPFTGLSTDVDCLAGRSQTVSWLVRMLAQYGKALYPAKSQAEYKLKWQPLIITPEYIAFADRFRWYDCWRFLLLTRAI